MTPEGSVTGRGTRLRLGTASAAILVAVWTARPPADSSYVAGVTVDQEFEWRLTAVRSP